MAALVKSARAPLPSRAARKAAGARRAVLAVKAFKEDPKAPDWLPAQAKPAWDLAVSDDIKLDVSPITTSSIYQTYIKEYAESSVVTESFGWKKTAELINGRAAMIGFLAGACAEVLTQKSMLTQLAAAPQLVVITVALIGAGSIIPIFKGTEGGYLESLKDTYTLPAGWFTEVNEKVHARVAMLGLGAMLATELLIGRAIL